MLILSQYCHGIEIKLPCKNRFFTLFVLIRRTPPENAEKATVFSETVMGGMRDPAGGSPSPAGGQAHSPIIAAHHHHHPPHARASSTPATPLASRTPPTTPHPPSPLVRSGSMPGSGGEADDHLPPLRPPPRTQGENEGSGGGRGMCRSVSDSTLRQAASRAALHLPLPVTSLMHFKVLGDDK